jgi:hypothetical protein
MSDFLESAKNLVNSAVSRTGWEANKQLRLRGKQGEIDKLIEQRQELMDQLGQIAMTLYQQGSLHDPQLSRTCASIFELDHDLRTREEQLVELKDEAYPVGQYASTPPPNYTPPPVSGTGTGTGPDSSTSGSSKCPQCGAALRPNALYCRGCGAKLR